MARKRTNSSRIACSCTWRQVRASRAAVVARDTAGELPGWTPGAHIDVHLAAGLVRQYSLIGDVSDRARYRFAVRRIAEGQVSSRLHDEVGVGDAITVSSPRNSFPLVDDRRPL